MKKIIAIFALFLVVLLGSVYAEEVFFDDFESGFGQWTESNEYDWNIEGEAEKNVPGHPSNNLVAHADNCDSYCVLTVTDAIDLSGYSEATLSFWRYVDKALDNGEYLKVEVYDGSSWNQIYYWTNKQGDDDTWHLESYELPAGYLVSSFKVRYTSKESGKREETEIDDVKVEGTPASVCGNDVREGSEVCDGTDLDGETCVSQGFDGGTLDCAGDCLSFVTTGCYDNTCSDTDGGVVTWVAGTTSGDFEGSPYSNSDSCVDADNVKEYYCSGDLEASQNYNCGTDDIYDVCYSGDVYTNSTDFSCSSGACDVDYSFTLKEECDYGCTNAECDPIPDSCSDTDGGWVPETFGTVSGYLSEVPYSYDDVCVGDVINEWSCSGNYPYLDNMTNCLWLNYTGCSSGACY